VTEFTPEMRDYQSACLRMGFGDPYAEDGTSGQDRENYTDDDLGMFRDFVEKVAALTKDGEGIRDGDPWVMENDDAYDTLHGLISDARGLLGWEPMKPPLDDVNLYGDADNPDHVAQSEGTHEP